MTTRVPPVPPQSPARPAPDARGAACRVAAYPRYSRLGASSRLR